MKWFKKNIESLSLIIAFIALLVSIISFFQSSDAELRTRDIEAYNYIKEISKNLNIKFQGRSLIFNTFDKNKETESERVSRIRDAGISLMALEKIVKTDEHKDALLFLKLVFLLEQGEYEEIEKIIKKEGGNYDAIGFAAAVIMLDYKKGLINSPELLFKKMLESDEKNMIANLVYSLILKDKGDYEKALHHLNNLGEFATQSSDLSSLKDEIIQKINKDNYANSNFN